MTGQEYGDLFCPASFDKAANFNAHIHRNGAYMQAYMIHVGHPYRTGLRGGEGAFVKVAHRNKGNNTRRWFSAAESEKVSAAWILVTDSRPSFSLNVDSRHGY